MKKLIYTLILIPILSLTSCKADQEENTNDQQESMIAPLPDPAKDYQENPYPWGFINEQGQLIIKANFDEVRPFSEGVALVRKNGKWGYIDKAGQVLLHPQYRAAWSFSNGLAKAQNEEHHYGYINKLGEWVIPAEFDELAFFNEDLASFRQGALFGYINKKGEAIIPAAYERAGKFINGYAIVRKDGQFGMIDTNNKTIIPFEYHQLKPFKEELARAKKEQLYGFINRKGEWVIAPTFQQLGDFNQGLAVALQNSEWTLINKEGKTVVSGEYEFMEYAGENRWLVLQDGLYNLIDNNGEFILKADITEIHHFSNGLAAFNLNEGWGYLTPDGEFQIPPVFLLSWPFQADGLARVATAEGLGIIDKEGKLIYPINPYYIEIREFQQGLAPVQLYQ